MTGRYPQTRSVSVAESNGVKIVPARDALYLEADALQNAEEVAIQMLVNGTEKCDEEEKARIRESIGTIVNFYYRIYFRDQSKTIPTSADFQDLIAYINSSEDAKLAWAAFSTSFAVAVPMQHVTNLCLMSQNQMVEKPLSRAVSYTAMILSLCTTQEGAESVRKLAAEAKLFGNAEAAGFLTAGPLGLVKDALAYVKEQLAPFRKKKEEPETK